MKIPISEIFYSLQWEGRNVWKPSIFVRFWWCNLKCTWCDSKYSWDATVEKANMMPLEDVIEIIKWFKCKHIIFTGGEPSLFQEQIIAIQKELSKIDDTMFVYSYEIETNWSKKLDQRIYLDQINISPKLWMSWNKEYIFEVFNFRWWKWWKCSKDLKFVVGSMQDIKEVEWFIKLHQSDIDKHSMNIYLMPLWRDFESQMNKIVMNYCMKKWYYFCMRSHLIRFGDGKGK